MATLLLSATGCSSSKDVLPTDAVMIEQWRSDKAALQNLVQLCEATEQTYDIAERYVTANGLVETESLERFEGCDVESDLLYLARHDDSGLYLLTTSQYRQGTGLIEEVASRWTNGWVSWKSAILEEKGYLYAPQAQAGLSEATLSRLSIVADPLDQFVGEYRATSQISGSSICEIWRLRPIESNWYLFYHQSRECPA